MRNMFENHYIYVRLSTNMAVKNILDRGIVGTLLVVLLFFPGVLATGKGSPTFTTTKQIPGFPLRVNCLFAERDGFLWVGTKKGLYRFDGYECRKFSSIITGHNALDKEIIDVRADSSGHILALTGDELVVYDRQTDAVREFGISGTVSCPCPNGFVIGAGQSLYRFDFKTMRPELIVCFGDGFRIAYIEGLPDGSVLCGSRFNGFRLVEPDSGCFKTPFPTENLHMTSMLVDSRGRIWVGLYNAGIRCFSLKGDILASYSTRDSNLSNDIILSMLEKDGNLWMGTDGGGICILTPSTGNIDCLKNRIGDDNSIPYNSILKVISDPFGNIWGIRVRGGAFIVRDMPIRTFKAVPYEKYGLSDNGVLCVYQSSGQSDLWIGTDGGGVNLFLADSQEFKWFPSTSGMKIADIAGFSEDKLMISAFSDGIFLLDRTDGHITRFKVHNNELHNYIVYSGNALNLHDEISGTVLMLSRAVFRYDPVSGSVRELSTPTTFDSPLSAVRSSTERSFLYDGKRIYGVYYDSDSVDVIHEVPPGLRISNVTYSDSGILWIATNGGVFSLNPSNGISSHLGTDLFSSSATVASERSHLWVGTDNALYLWNSDNKSFRSYSFPQSAYSNEFRPKATLVSLDGTVYLGGMDGLMVINSTEPTTDGALPEIELSDVSVNSRICPGLCMGDNLKVKWTTASIGVDVHAKGDDLFERRLFLFRVNGLDTVRQHSPYFTLRNFRPGKYTIDVALASSDESQTKWYRTLSVTVPAPWYKSLAFRILLVLAFTAALVFWIVRWNRNAMKDMRRELDMLRRKSEDDAFLLRLSHCVQLNLNEPDMDINLICRELGISHSALFKRVKQITGASIKEYIDKVRIEQAQELVRFTDLSFTEISSRIGFASSRYFSTFFKRKTGMTPSECRMSAPRRNGK